MSVKTEAKKNELLQRTNSTFAVTVRPVASGGAGGHVLNVPPTFRQISKPYLNQGGTLSPLSITCPPDFQTLQWPYMCNYC